MRAKVRFGALGAFGLSLGMTLASGGVVRADEPAAAVAQDVATQQDVAPPKDGTQGKGEAEPFAKVQAEWKQIEAQLDETIQAFRKAGPDERDKVREKYMGLLADAKAILPRLRSSALAEYQAAPNKDAEVVRVLVGILANDVRSDDNGPALEVSKVLLEKQAAEDAIYGLAGVAAFASDNFDLAEKYLTAAKQKEALDPIGESYLEQIEDYKKYWKKEQEIRAAEAKADDLPRVKLTTNRGVIVIELFENEAPIAVANFISLIEKKYYDGLTFHRVLGNFMAQGGCPKGDGTGGPGYNIPCECGQENFRRHFAGTLSMAHAGPDTGGSQFFITFRPTPHLDSRHTAFGRVIEGIDVLPKLERRDPQRSRTEPDKILKAEVLRKRNHAYVPTKTDKGE